MYLEGHAMSGQSKSPAMHMCDWVRFWLRSTKSLNWSALTASSALGLWQPPMKMDFTPLTSIFTQHISQLVSRISWRELTTSYFLTATKTPPPDFLVLLVLPWSRRWIAYSELNLPAITITPSAWSSSSQVSVPTTMSGSQLSTRFWNWPRLSVIDLQFALRILSVLTFLFWRLLTRGSVLKCW